MQIQDAIDDFLTYCSIEKGLTSSTIESYHHDLISFATWLKEKNKIFFVKELDKFIFNQYLIVLDQSMVARSMARHLTTLRQFCVYLKKEGYTTKELMNGITQPKIKRSLPRILTTNEMKQLLDIPLNTPFDYRNKAMLELMYATGMRVSEIIKLTVYDLDFSVQLIKIYGKGRKERIVPFGDYAKYYINRI